jgi:lipopolysaccharide export LptBFGC system permease protein LptF
MLNTVSQIYSEALLQITRILTGRLFTEEQIKSITKHSLGRYLEALFPENEEEVDRTRRISIAQEHIISASKIMAEMRVDLDAQAEVADFLAAEIEEKKELAKKYSALAQNNQDAASAMRMEIEEAINQELRRQSLEGRTARKIASTIIWCVTLVIGAALGTYFKDITSFLMTTAWP